MTESLQARVPILLYHRVVPELGDPAIECYRLLQIATSQAAFERQMLYLRANHTVIGLRDLVAALTAKRPLPDNACVITFDDSYSDHYHYAFPVLESLGLVATFFIESGHTAEAGRIRCLDRYYYLLDHSPLDSFTLSLSDGSRLDSHPLDALSKMNLVQNFGLKRWLKQSDAITQDGILTELEKALQVNMDAHALSQELYLSVQEMEEMVRGGMELGAHTIHHPSLLHVDFKTARNEILESGDFVKKVAGTDKVAFAYPFGEGSNSPSIRRLVRDYGYYAACSSDAGLNSFETNPLELKRLEIVGDTL